MNEVLSPVVKESSIRVLLAMVALFDLELEQLDVKTAFLHGDSRSDYDSCVYHRKLPDGSFVYFLLYVDDMLIAAKSMVEINKLKTQLSGEFEMKDLGAAKKILGMEIHRDRRAGKFFLSQKNSIEKVLERFGMQNSKPVSIPLAAHFLLLAALFVTTV